MSNPFLFGKPVRGSFFKDRRHEINRLIRGIYNGQSILLTAEPCMGKTSILYRIQEPDLYDRDYFNKLRFKYINAQTIIGWNSQRFWKYILDFLPHIDNLHKTQKKDNFFDKICLESVFQQLEKDGLRLVLLIDEFDQILEEPGLHRAEFYGTLRDLAQRFSSLCLIIASRQSVAKLNQRTKEFTHGSPYFNFVSENILGVFYPDAILEVLNIAQEKFSKLDISFLHHISGGHPYFLQVAAHFLWETYENEIQDLARRFTMVSNELLNHAIPVMKEIWSAWSPYEKMAFTLIALNEMPRLLPERRFDLKHLFENLHFLTPELRNLRDRGFLREDDSMRFGYALQAEVMIWFLADELTQMLRPDNPDFTAWLQEQEWEGILKHGQIRAIKNILFSLEPILKEGSKGLIKIITESTIKGAASGMVKLVGSGGL